MSIGRLCEVAVLATLAMMIPHPAFAYIDPGLGSLVFQGAVAAFVTIAGAWAALRTKIRDFFARFQNADRAGENAPK